MQQWGKRAGIPPSHPSPSSRLFNSDFFLFDSLPPPIPHQRSPPTSSLSGSPEVPPRGFPHHRRSKSELASEKDLAGDDLIREFMNLEKLETLGDSLENSEDEAESSGSIKGSKKRHSRSLSMDSLVGKQGVGSSAFALDLRGRGEFTSSEIEKIMANEKLVELAMADPKRVKRILANRQSAARSKQRKIHYISELEQKVKTLQAEATTLSAQLTILQRDTNGLTNQNNELKIRVQAMEQQAHLRDALNKALSAEVQRLKLANGEIGDAHSHPSRCSAKQTQIDSQVFQLQHRKETTDSSLHQVHHQQQQQNNLFTKLESS